MNGWICSVLLKRSLIASDKLKWLGWIVQFWLNPIASFWQRKKWLQHLMLRKTDQMVRSSELQNWQQITKQISVCDIKYGEAKSTLREHTAQLPRYVDSWLLASETGLLLADVGLVYLSLHSEDVAQCLKCNSARETCHRGSRLLLHNIRKHQSRRCFISI